MADTPAISPLRARPGVVCLYIWPTILWQRSRILRDTHHRYFAWILRIHALSHSGSDRRYLPHARIVFFSYGM